MSRMVFNTKGKDHTIKRDVLHDISASSSYKIGSTHIVCGATTSVHKKVNDGSNPILFETKLQSSGLSKQASPNIQSVEVWMNEVFNDPDLFSNVNRLVVSTPDNQTCYYQQVHLVLYIIDDDGCVFDVAILAAVSALLQLNLNDITIGVDGLCQIVKGSEYKLDFAYHPVPFSFFLQNGDGVQQAYLSFILSEDKVNHVSIHGGKALVSTDLLCGCITKCRTVYQTYLDRLLN
ncbi:hypothetical protein EIN_064460 [Entamoeba invadens IP1]|uniref:Ribosomal RNA-processing protein 43 n=1 Tax=Entamoeba invadens IP1 TaxID=370355 RepID=A0A0A1TV90_ENTIV|nr:hypothetical protein EIN_064460 [Entamoeba invadens IP1]ELP84221.1 hypothetical protein EIN_064460 [Entamoeba invadens IP1]|eukprot:XP_004183567.1 hypothetical protein EIN_064460 [Entamoeba invadens IP1]